MAIQDMKEMQPEGTTFIEQTMDYPENKPLA